MQNMLIIDPIDGTSSFIIGRPIFGTLIALTYDNNPIIGVLDQPISNERWIGISEIGSYFFNTQLQKLAITSTLLLVIKHKK